MCDVDLETCERRVSVAHPCLLAADVHNGIHTGSHLPARLRLLRATRQQLMTYRCGQVAGVAAGAVVLALAGAVVTLAGIRIAGHITTR